MKNKPVAASKVTKVIQPVEKKPFNIDDYVTWNLSKDDVNQIKQAFDILDLGGSGSISPNDILDAFRDLGFGQSGSGHFANGLLQRLAKGQTQRLDFHQFLNLATGKLNANSSQTDINRVFQAFDVHKTGKFNHSDLKKILKELGDDLGDEQIDSLISVASKNNDGYVTVQDFYSIMTDKACWDQMK